MYQTLLAAVIAITLIMNEIAFVFVTLRHIRRVQHEYDDDDDDDDATTVMTVSLQQEDDNDDQFPLTDDEEEAEVDEIWSERLVNTIF